ncbi:MAG TPA: glycosyltransferase family 2 protein [Gaiellaceae bacterium]|nr:glycosyltransferase family 2 protein [Gaiellaceae bacterium]
MSRQLLSVVVPVHDEEESLRELTRRVLAAAGELDGLDVELVLVDDGSRDRSYPLLVELARGEPRIRVVRLARNFGHQVALTAGIEHARGDAVVTMDADLQHPPEVIEQFVAEWRAGHDVVYGVMRDRPEGFVKRVTARLFYVVLNRLATDEMPSAAGDFRLIDRKVVDAFLAMRERDRYLRGMFAWLGFSQAGVEYVPAARFAGRSKYSLRKMSQLAFDAIFSFSILPLRIVLGLGLAVSAVAFLFGIASALSKVFGVYTVPGWATIVVVVTFIGGVQLVVLGGIGEYLGRVYEEVKRRPLYVVRALHNFDDEPRC